jgi:hypothetical protein
MLVYRTNVAASRDTNPARPTQRRRDMAASVASIAQARSPDPAATNEASVKVGM